MDGSNRLDRPGLGKLRAGQVNLTALVDMLRHSKALIDAAANAGVGHIVHLGACGRDDTTVGHWAWHQLVERYIEGAGVTWTHLRPEAFMQNLLSYGGKRAVVDGVVHAFVEDARLSWVDVENVAEVAAATLQRPDLHAGKTYRLGYEAASHSEIAAFMTAILGHSPEVSCLIGVARRPLRLTCRCETNCYRQL